MSSDQAVRIGRAEGQPDEDDSDPAYVEPYLAVRPGAPQRLSGGAIVVSPERNRPIWTCAILSSRDGAETWTAMRLELQGCVDPWVVFPDRRTVLFSAIEVRANDAAPRQLRLVLRRSIDDGRTWLPGPELGPGHDHELLAVDRSGGPHDGAVYLTAQRRLPAGDDRTGHLVPIYRSDDGGDRFGRVAQLWLDERPLRPTGLEVLSDGALVLTIHDRTRGDEAAADRRGWALDSRDGGITWSDRHLVTEACGPTPELPGYPVLSSGPPTGSFPDRLYHVCVRSGLDGIAVTTSDDAGRTWSEVVRADAAADEGRADVRSPAAAVAPDGTIGLTWYGRGVAGDPDCQHTYFTASTDGGLTFLAPLRLSETVSCPEVETNRQVSRSWPTGGDYGSLTVDDQGVFRATWADARSGVFQLRQAAVRVVR